MGFHTQISGVSCVLLKILKRRRKKMLNKKNLFLLLSLLLVISISMVGYGQDAVDDWPNRVVRILVPTEPGGGSDTLCRVLAPFLAEELGTDVIIENRPGAGHQVALSLLLNAVPDGYVLSQVNQPNMSMTILVQDAPYTVDDFAYLNFHHIDPIAFNVLNDKPWSNFKELTDYILENPGEIAIGASQASGSYIFMEYLKDKMGLDFISVPYDGGGPGRAALLGGHIDVYCANAFANSRLAEQSKCLGVVWEERSVIWPEAPTFAEMFNDEEMSEIGTYLASYRALVIQKEFKEQYPKRWEKLVQAYKVAYYSEGHMAQSEKIGQLPVMFWVGPEESDRIAAKIHEVIKGYAHLFK